MFTRSATIHNCDRQTDGQTNLLRQTPGLFVVATNTQLMTYMYSVKLHLRHKPTETNGQIPGIEFGALNLKM